jgi:replication initiator protein A
MQRKCCRSAATISACDARSTDVYELARKHCGRQQSWRIGVETLQKKCGSKQEDKHFAAHLRELAHSNHLPDYEFRLDLSHAVFTRRAAATAVVEHASPVRVAPSPAPLVPPAAVESPGKRSIIISQSAMEQMCDAAPGWDRYMLERLYMDWAADKDCARDEDARFLGWARSFTKRKAPA